MNPSKPKRVGIPAPMNRPGAGMRALGRLPTGHMNKTEAAYAEWLENERLFGRILWWRFEGYKLRLADNTFLTVDFAVLQQGVVVVEPEFPRLVTGGERIVMGGPMSVAMLEFHEVKGFAQDDAMAKLKIAADLFPHVFVLVRGKQAAKRDGGQWTFTRTEVGRG